MTATPAAPDATQLAVDRTRLAHDRTLLAWVRTATSLISFGFSIYKFFQYMREEALRPRPVHEFGSRHFAMVMVATGVIALAVATLQHRRDMELLRAQFGRERVPYSSATLLAGLIGLLGIVALVLVVARL